MATVRSNALRVGVALIAALIGCGDDDGKKTSDAAVADSGRMDAGVRDSGPTDAGPLAFRGRASGAGTCADPYLLEAGEHFRFTFNPTDTPHGNNHAVGCDGAGSATVDKVVSYTPPSNGILFVTTKNPDTLASSTIIYVRRGDCVTGEELACSDSDHNGGSQTVRMWLPVTGGQPHFIIFDGSSSSSEALTQVVIHFLPNKGAGGDTCDNAKPLDLVGDEQHLVAYASGNTAGATPDYASGDFSCSGYAATGQATAPDVVYSFSLPTEMRVSIEMNVQDTDEGSFYIRNTGCLASSEVLCEYSGGEGYWVDALENIPAGNYMLIVDGVSTERDGGVGGGMPYYFEFEALNPNLD